jgi:DNA (cytosine-5)-methyltransferase 1
MPIPVIDVFAGPGGLSEGFSSVKGNGKLFFDVKLSIEKDPIAHRTLELRSFYRQFIKQGKPVPPEYYDVLRETDIDKREAKRKALLESYPEGKIAKKDALLHELGPKTREHTDALIKKALGKNHKKDWVLIGGPPCQAYSLVGRSRVGGINENDHRVYLYQEYLHIIAEHQPAVFVMENVKGLLSASLNGEKIFHKILGDLSQPSLVTSNKSCPDYNIYSLVKKDVSADKDYLIKAENYGVPQKRHRVILLGIRNDIRTKPSVLTLAPQYTSLESIIGKLPPVRSAISRTFDSVIINEGKGKRNYSKVEDTDLAWRKFISEFKSDIFSWNGFSAKDLNGKVSFEYGRGAEFIPYNEETLDINHPLYKWYYDKKLKGVINHESRSHLLQDIKRYLFSSLYTKKYNKFPRLEHIEQHSASLLPDHKNVKSGNFNDRFRVQLRDIPATTVTSHISKDGHYFIHYDPLQSRSLTVREAARIQTFPDNYLFCGSRTQQFHQVGNAVPPYLAKQIGEIVKEVFKN